MWGDRSTYQYLQDEIDKTTSAVQDDVQDQEDMFDKLTKQNQPAIGPGTNVNINAKLIKEITYSEVISKNLRVMDLTAISLANESGIPIYITNIFEKDSLIRALKEEGNYSKIH